MTRKLRMLLRAVMISSARPSLKHWCSGSELKLVNGRTAMAEPRSARGAEGMRETADA